jgi:cyclic pyranopterin phosphate synthase
MGKLTHLDDTGAARMVDVGGKADSARSATATGRIRMSGAALGAVRDGSGPKGDVLAAARIAAMQCALPPLPRSPARRAWKWKR